MATTADMTAASSEFELGGKKRRIAPLRDKDFGEFERWVQDRYITLAKRNLDGLEPEDRATLLKRAFDKAANITMQSPEAMQLMTSVEGATFLLWLSLRRDDPSITQEEVLQWVMDAPELLDEAMDKIDIMNRLPSFPGVDKPKKRRARQTPRKKRTRRKTS